MEKITLEQTILALAKDKKYKTLRDIITVINPIDIANALNLATDEIRLVLFRLIPKQTAAEVFVELDEDVQVGLIRDFSDNELSAVVTSMYVDDAADIIEEMPANVVSRILKTAPPDKRKMINEILRYPEDSAGSIMNTDYLSLRPTMTAEHAVSHIRKTGASKETVNTLYVLDKNRTLIGVVSLRDLVFSHPEDTIGDIMDTGVITATTLDDKENVALTFEKYNLTELPVVDTEKRLVGIVTVDDAIDVLQEEATEDIEKMAAITPSDKPYLKTSALSIFSKRIPWLMLLMISATFTGMIISSFETALATLPVLTAFIPMLMDTGGNSGSQASVTVIRGISLGDIAFSDIFKVLFKEFRVSILCGAALSLLSFCKIMLVDKLLLGSPITVMTATVISVTLLLTVIIAKLVGGLLPLVAKKVGFDPAVMASPFITTIVDALSLLVYFALAMSLLNLNL